MTSHREHPIIKLPLSNQRQTGRQYAELAPAGHKGRQVMDMDGYQIVMICISAMTLLLKLIEVFLNQINKK